MKTVNTTSSTQNIRTAWLYVYILSALGTSIGIFLGSFGDILLNIDTQLIGAVIGTSIGGGLQHRYRISHLMRCIATSLGVSSGLLLMIGMPPMRIHSMVFVSLVGIAVVGVTMVRLSRQMANHSIVEKRV